MGQAERGKSFADAGVVVTTPSERTWSTRRKTRYPRRSRSLMVSLVINSYWELWTD